MTWRFRVLGPARAVRPDGTEAPLGGARLRALLAALAAAGGRTVPVDGLAAQLWAPDEEPPAEPVKAVQALVGRLRRALGRDAVASLPGGYRLAAELDAIDLFRFERLAAEGAAALGAGEHGRAAGLLDEALGLWDGPALLDLPERASDPVAVRAERRLAEARRDRLAARVGLGQAASALDELTALAAADPLDEPLQALRLRALRASGRTAQALAAYEEVRRLLAERLGTDPGAELRALHGELLKGGGDGGGRDGGRGGSHEGGRDEDCGGGRRKEPGGSGASGFAPGNLRAPLTSFLGRERELSELARELSKQRLVTLLGPGGVGKTRLALQAALTAPRTGTEVWPDGAWVAELAPVHDAETVAEAVLTALGARETAVRGPGPSAEELGSPAQDPVSRLVEHCGRRRLLLVLDNCEHLVGAAAELVQALLTRCPGVRVLATSREPLGVPGEAVRPVEPLPRDAALRLLAERGAAARPGFRVGDDLAACTEICVRLDGLPLAVELAAARLRLLAPRQLADRLDDRFRLLGKGTGSRTALPRQQTLRAVVDWSWDLLDEGERTVLRRLAVFKGGCALDQAEEVCGPGTLEALGSLVDKSLVVAEPTAAPEPSGTGGTGGGGHGAVTQHGPAEHDRPEGAYGRKDTYNRESAYDRGQAEDAYERDQSEGAYGGSRHGGMRYRLLETVAEYAGERLDEAGEREFAGRRHLAAYRELARAGEPELRGPRQAGWLRRFEVEHDNFRAALRAAVALREEQQGLCLALCLSWFWQLRGHQVDAVHWSAAVAALGPDPFDAPVREAVALAERCTDTPPPWGEEQLWEARRGVRLLVQAGSSADGPDSPASPELLAYMGRIVAAYHRGQPQICRQPGSLWYFARLMTGGFAGLAEALDAAEQDCRELAGESWELGLTLLMRANAPYSGRGAADRGAHAAAEALRAFERSGDPWGIAEALAARGAAYARQGRDHEAAADFERAMAQAARMGARHQVPAFRARLADVRLRIAEAAPDAAARAAARERAERELLEAAEDSARVGGEPFSTPRLLLARQYARTGRTARAREQLDELERGLDGAHALFLGTVAGLRGRLDCADGAYERALAHLRDAVRHFEEFAYQVAPGLVVDQLPAAAWARACLGAAEEGARLLGAYDRFERAGDLGLRPFPEERELRDRAAREVRSRLDARAYRRALAEGGALSLREAAALVR